MKTELGDIQRTIADKDAELRVAKEYLNGLKEVFACCLIMYPCRMPIFFLADLT